jgi:Uma2 family endonuclease
MANPSPRDRVMSVNADFAFEEASSERHEYVDGQVHAMSGATREHSRIAGNIFALLWSAPRGGPFRIRRGEVKLRAGKVVHYPDVMAACGPPPRDPRVEEAPSVGVEVVSPQAEGWLRLREKAAAHG